MDIILSATKSLFAIMNILVGILLIILLDNVNGYNWLEYKSPNLVILLNKGYLYTI